MNQVIGVTCLFAAPVSLIAALATMDWRYLIITTVCYGLVIKCG